MKKNYFFKSLLLMIPVTAFALMSLSGGRDGGFSGSPGDGGATCTQCHSGGSFGLSPTITTNIPASGYDVNTTYDITVTGAAAPGGGFQLTAEKVSDDSKVGTLIAGTGSQLVNGGTHITHSNSSNSSWTFQWTSPSTDESQVKFYAAVIAGNGGGTGGDEVATTSTAVGSLGINEAKRLDFSMYPNPASEEKVTIQLPTGTLKALVNLYDISGRLIKSKEVNSVNNKISVNGLSKGVYLLKVAADGKIGAQQFVKE